MAPARLFTRLIASFTLSLLAPGCSQPPGMPPPMMMTSMDMTPPQPPAPQQITCPVQPGADAASPYEGDVYLRGTMNNWGVDPDAAFLPTGPSVLSLAIKLPKADYQFKVADASWTPGSNFGAGPAAGPTLPLGHPSALADGGGNVSLHLDQDGLYCLTLDASDPLHPALTFALRQAMRVSPARNLQKAGAYFLSTGTIAWAPPQGVDPAALSYFLYHDPAGRIFEQDGGVYNGQPLPLMPAGPLENNAALAMAFPYLHGYVQLATGAAMAQVADLLREQLALVVKDRDGTVLAATSLQTFAVIDHLFTYTGDDLGVTFSAGAPTLRLWAPTAQAVRLHLYDTADATTPSRSVDLQRGNQGVWSVSGDATWKDKFYLYEVHVVARARGLLTNLVTDPYSLSLSTDSLRSQIVDLDDPALKPPGWDTLKKPDLAAPQDIVLYELHVRDFSINDMSVPAAHRGLFAAFTDAGSNGMQHLAKLAQAGLTHLHLMPVADFASVEEDRGKQLMPQVPMAAPDSPDQQAAVEKVRGKDGYDWGYDPYHYNVPEGSYATDPNGSARILEFRAAVQALAQTGLRVVLDVVYNHTYAAGQDKITSVLDRVVPDYYYRLAPNGDLQNTTCCADTATEHAMMEKLMVDSLRLWARAYKADGFRFDYMGYHTLDNMKHVRQALDALTPDHDGVDGKQIYLYGEAWKSGSLLSILPDQSFYQGHTYGSGIGSFNDRIRDSIHGGGPFSGLADQGFATGLSDDFNADPADTETSPDPAARKAEVLGLADTIRVGLAGNLRDYTFTGASGMMVRGQDVLYRGSPGTGYAAGPEETINYVSAHDNNTLWDYIEAKAPRNTPGRTPVTATLDDRVRMQGLALDLVALAQGVPFFLAGEDMLRSKSGDGDSFQSGDWFNRLDFSYQDNNWGVGLPPAPRNMDKWGFWGPRLADPALKPAPAHIQRAVAHLREALQIRRSSALFRLRTADDIQKRLSFLNVGPAQVPGLIVMALSDQVAGLPDLDPDRKAIYVLFNANAAATDFSDDAFKAALVKHPVQQASSDPVVQAAPCGDGSGKITVPGRTTLVCVLP